MRCSKELDPFGSVHMMAESGASKGSFNQIRQLAGMRGLMAERRPARSFQSPSAPTCARAYPCWNTSSPRTAPARASRILPSAQLTSGYLTRRLVDVSQDVIVREDDCGTTLGIPISRPPNQSVPVAVVMRMGVEVQSVTMDVGSRQVIGRFAAEPVAHPETGEVLVAAYRQIDKAAVRATIAAGIKSIAVLEDRDEHFRRIAPQIIGWVAAEAIVHPDTDEVLVAAYRQIDEAAVRAIIKAEIKSVTVREEDRDEHFRRIAFGRLLRRPHRRGVEELRRLVRHPAMLDQAAQLLDSPAMRAAEQAAEQRRWMADQAAQLLDSPAMRAAEQAAEQRRWMADQAAQLLDSPAMRAAEQAAEQYRWMADQAAQLLDSPAMRAAEQAAEQYRWMADQAAQLLDSPAMRAAEQAAEQRRWMADQAAQLLDSPAMRAAEQAAEQYRRMADQAAQLLDSPAMRAAEQAAEQYRRMADQATAQLDFLDHPRLLHQFEQAHQTASKLLADMPPLTPELFGGAWNESVAEAVRRLERTEALAEDLDGDADEDAAIVQEAAPPEAQARVKARLSWLGVRRGLERLEKLLSRLVLIWTLLGQPVPDASTTTQLLGVTVPPSGPPVPMPAPDSSTTRGIEPVATALTLPRAWSVEGLPAIVERAGPTAAERVVEFFAVEIRNGNTRAAYAKAVTQFFRWCDEHNLELDQISAVSVAAYVEELQGRYRAPTIKQHLAAIRRLFDWLVAGEVIPWNPTAAVRGPTHVVKRGKTPVLQPGEVRLLLDSIDTSAIGGLRDRALMGVMIYSFARVSAVVNMDVDDYYQQGNSDAGCGCGRRAASTAPCRSTTRRRHISTHISRPPGSRPTKVRRCGAH